MTDNLKEIWEKVDERMGQQRMETEAEHIARDIREGNFPKRSDRIQVPVNPPPVVTAPEHWPRPRQIAPIKAQGDFTGDDWLICSFGNSGEDGRDWALVTDSVRASELADCYFPSDAKHDAEFLVQLLDAYRSGRIVLATPAALAASPEVQALVMAEMERAIAAVIATCDAEIAQAKKLGPMHVPIIISVKHDCIAAIRAGTEVPHA